MFSHTHAHTCVVDARYNLFIRSEAENIVAYGTNSAFRDRNNNNNDSTVAYIRRITKRTLTFTGFTSLTCYRCQLMKNPLAAGFKCQLATKSERARLKDPSNTPNMFQYLLLVSLLLLLILLNCISPLSKWRKMHFISSVPHMHNTHTHTQPQTFYHIERFITKRSIIWQKYKHFSCLDASYALNHLFV